MSKNEKIKIIFENNAFVVVDKNCGQLSVPSRLGADEPRPCTGILLEKQLGIRLWPAHRLDFEVSGILLFCKNADSHKIANRAFEEHLVLKTYEAWTETPAINTSFLDLLKESPQFLRSKLMRGKKRAFEASYGKDSVTRAHIQSASRLTTGKDIFVWELQPLTGRSHQLRYEMQKLGCPILGDLLYSSTVKLNENVIALRAIKLELKAGSELEQLGLPPCLKIDGIRLDIHS